MHHTVARFEMPSRNPCPFCELAAGRGETRHIIDATEKTLTFINMRQFEIGQLLIIPRRHAPTILDLMDDEAVEIMNKLRTAAEALTETFNPDGITVYQNNGVTSLQEVPHFHIHVVPRRKSSDWGSGPPHIAALQPENLEVKQQVTVSWERAEEIAAIVKSNFKIQ
jgi:histidine triad (HIT) family protein